MPHPRDWQGGQMPRSCPGGGGNWLMHDQWRKVFKYPQKWKWEHHLLSGQICRNTTSGTKTFPLQRTSQQTSLVWQTWTAALPAVLAITASPQTENCNLYQLYHVYEDNQLPPTLVSKDLYSRLNNSRNNDQACSLPQWDKRLFLLCAIHDTPSEEWSDRKPPGFQELIKISYDT